MYSRESPGKNRASNQLLMHSLACVMTSLVSDIRSNVAISATNISMMSSLMMAKIRVGML